jgi:hydrogenase nickel incorporation protein HypB
MAQSKISIVENILNANDQFALANKQLLDKNHIKAINIMASPGSGKTATILKTIHEIREQLHIAVIEGDTAPVTIDADKIDAENIPVTQINTGGACHLDAMMVRNGLNQLDLTEIDLLIIENVGNLVCPAAFKLGVHYNIVVASIPEGDDKPYKYPNIYRGIDCLLLNKIDLLPYLEFDMGYFSDGIKILNPDAEIFPVSAKTGEGFEKWTSWLLSKIK